MTRPRVLFVGRTRYQLPLAGWLAKKWDAIEHELDYHVLATAANGGAGNGRFELARPLPLLDGPLFYASLPLRIGRAIRRLGPDVIVAEDPHVAAAALLARTLAGDRDRPRILTEVHGNWRYATRLYGAPARRLLGPAVDALDAAALRRVDAVRTLSRYTSGLVEEVRGRGPDGEFPTYSDLSAFAGPRAALPERPTALFVGALERYKNVEGLASAWRHVARELPRARLVLLGKGPQQPIAEALAAELGEQVRYLPEVASPAEVARRMDASWVLVLPSRFEGFGRVVIESFARGRGVIGGTGGVRDIVEEGVNGLLVDPEDVDALAAALLRVLGDRGLAERYGAAAAASYERWHTTPEQFAERLRKVVEAALD